MNETEVLARSRRNLRIDKITTSLGFALVCGMEGLFIEADAPLWLKIGYAVVASGSAVPSYRRIHHAQVELSDLEQYAVNQSEEVGEPESINTNPELKLIARTVNHDYSSATLREFLGLNSEPPTV